MASQGTAAPMASDEQSNAGTSAASANSGTREFSLGWLLAQLYGPLPDKEDHSYPHLPTLAELPKLERMEIAFDELDTLLVATNCATGTNPVQQAWQGGNKTAESLHPPLRALNLSILAQLVTDPARLAAFQVGRALSDTCSGPKVQSGPNTFFAQFNQYRIARLRTWLAEARSCLAPNASTVLAQSLVNWQDWCNANARSMRGRRWWDRHGETVVDALHRQSYVWLAVAVGQASTEDDADLEAWIQAAASVARMIRRVTWEILRRFYPFILVILFAIGGLLYLSISRSSGATSVWSSLVTIAGGLGITGTGLRAGAKKATTNLGDGVMNAARSQALGWQATVLPQIRQSPVRRYRLWRTGTAAPVAGRRLARYDVSKASMAK